MGPEFPLADVVANRRKQVVFRLAVCVVTAGCYAPLVGWTETMLWAAAYFGLQAIEVAYFNVRRPVFAATDRAGQWVALTLLALNSVIFGGLALLEAWKLAAWGEVCAAYLLAGSILNTVLTTIGCRAAFIASLAPFLAYAVLLPFVALVAPDPPSGLIVFCVALAGVLLGFGAIRLWREWSDAKAAERAAIARDIAERSANERRLIELSRTDALTGLGNRTLLQMRLAELVAAADQAALLMVDLDGFKYVNDTLGHSAGDEVLREVAARIGRSARGGDLAVRLGGDEFALLLPAVQDVAVAEQVAARVIAAASLPVRAGGQSVNIGASVGIAVYPTHGSNEEDLLANADLALYKAKAEGRHCSRFYDAALRADAHRRLSGDGQLIAAIERSEFALLYQPQIRLSDGALAGVEAILHWHHPERGLLGPELLSMEIENSHQAALVGRWMIGNGCRQAALWRRSSPVLRLGINLIGAQFRAGDLVEIVSSALAAVSLPPQALELEITEAALLQHESRLARPLRDLRDLGVGITFDHFGSGHAALGLLKRLPLSRLKIDQNFTRSLCGDVADSALVRAVIGLARACSLPVIADGVETRAQADLLTRDGCDEAQGSLFCPALDAEAFGDWMTRRPRLVTSLHA